MTTTLPTPDLAILLVDAFRYCLGRRTYAVDEYVRIATAQWGALPAVWQQLIHREIREAIATSCAGDACDVADWQRLLQLPITA